MNGLVPVALGYTATAIQKIGVRTYGSNDSAVGTISLLANATTTHSQIQANGASSEDGRFVVPTGYTAYLDTWNCTMSGQTGTPMIKSNVSWWSRSTIAAYQRQREKLLQAGQDSGGLDGAYLRFLVGFTIKLAASVNSVSGSPTAFAAMTLVVIGN